MAGTENLITKITRKDDSSSSSEFNIGTFFENVLHTTDNGPDFSLNDFYNHYANFINDGTFMMYSEREPQSKQVKVWWRIWEDTTISANSRVSLSQTEIEESPEGIVQTIENFIFPIYIEIPIDYSVNDIQGILLSPYVPPDPNVISIGSFATNAVEWAQDSSDLQYIKVELKEGSKWNNSDSGPDISNDGSTIRITYSSND